MSLFHTPPRPSAVVHSSNLQKVMSFIRRSGYEPCSYACMLSRDVDAMLARLEGSVQVQVEQTIAASVLTDTVEVRGKFKRES